MGIFPRSACGLPEKPGAEELNMIIVCGAEKKSKRGGVLMLRMKCRSSGKRKHGLSGTLILPEKHDKISPA